MAIVDEEAILSVLENSQTFLPLSQTSNQSGLGKELQSPAVILWPPIGRPQYNPLKRIHAVMMVSNSKLLRPSITVDDCFCHSENSQDRVLDELLAGFEDPRFQADVGRQNTLANSGSCPYNSDEEEAGPELEREDAELSIMMSQRWDNDILEQSSRQRFVSFLTSSSPAF